MRRYVREWSGTAIPVVLVVFIVAAYIDDTYFDPLTWERPVSYFWGMLWHGLGEYALLRMVVASYSEGEHPALLLLSFLYQKAMFFLVYAALSIASASIVWPQTFAWFDDTVIFALFIGTTMSTSLVNAILYFGWWRGWLEEPSDPIPFRPLYRWLRKR